MTKLFKWQNRDRKQSKNKSRMRVSGKVSIDIATAQANRVSTAILKAVACKSIVCGGELRVPNKKGKCKICGTRLAK